MNCKRITSGLFLLFLFGFSTLYFPNIGENINLDESSIKDIYKNNEELIETLPDASSLTISDWADLSGEVAEWLEAQALSANGYSWNQSGIFYYNQKQGSAGIGMLFLELFQKTKDSSYLDVADKIGWQLDKIADNLVTKGKWQESTSLFVQNFTGLDYGAAGIGKFFYTLYELTLNSTYLDHALDISIYLESIKTSVSPEIDKYPRKESTVVNFDNKAFKLVDLINGTNSAGSISDLETNNDVNYNISSVSYSVEEKNDFNPYQYRSYSIGELAQYTSNAVRISQQFKITQYPVDFDGGIQMMVIKDSGLTEGGLTLSVYEANPNGSPNTNVQIGSTSDLVSYSAVDTVASDNAWILFDWTSGAPLLNGSSTYGYCLVLQTTNTNPNYFMRAVATTNSAYSKGNLYIYETSWIAQSTYYDLVFNITDASTNYVVGDFYLNLTDFGIGFNEDPYINQLDIDCRAFSSDGVVDGGVFVYKSDEKVYERFGVLTGTEQIFTISLTTDVEDYLIDGPFRTIKVRILSGDPTTPHDVSIDLLEVTLDYSDEVYAFDRSYGAAGIGEYYLDLYELTYNSTYLQRATKAANYLIDNAKLSILNSLKCAAWEFEEDQQHSGEFYKTSVSDGVAGVGTFLLRLSKLNITDTIYRDYARYCANWLLYFGTDLTVYDHLGNEIGVGTYWRFSNSSFSTSYTGLGTGTAGIGNFILQFGMTENFEDTSNIYLDVAIKVGNFLFSSYSDPERVVETSAIQSIYTYTWTEKSFYSQGEEPKLSNDLGTAGVMKFLNNLYKSTNNNLFSKAVSGAYEYLRTNAIIPTSGQKYWNLTGTSDYFYGVGSGVAGIAKSLLNIDFYSFDSIESSIDALNWLYTQRYEDSGKHYYNYSVGSDIIYSGLSKGTAGVGLAFLDMYKVTSDNKWFSYASKAAKSLQYQADWERSNYDSSISNGIADGVAGIGLFFLELAKISPEDWYNNTLISIADYLLSQVNMLGGQCNWENSTSDSTIYYGWDYGVAGIMYFFTELFKYTQNQVYLDLAEGAANYLNNQDTSGSFSYYAGGSGSYYGFSLGSAGNGYSLMNLYEITKNSTYNDVIVDIKTDLTNEISPNSIAKSSSDSNKYNGIEDGQAGILKFFSSYYKNSTDSSTLSSINTLVTYLLGQQETAGNFRLYSGSSTYYNSYRRGTAGIIGGLIATYEENIEQNSISIINKIKNYLINQQAPQGYWNDNSDATIYLGYYSGVAGIADQLLKVPDLKGPSLSAYVMNISSLNDMQYFNTLKIDVSSSDIESGLDNLILAYRLDSGSWTEKLFTYVSGTVYSTTLPSQDYNTNVEFYIVSMDGTGLLTVDDNSGALYTYTVKDNEEPNIEELNTYDSDDNPNSIQYATGGKIVIKIDEPEEASGINTVSITYKNINLQESDTVSMTLVSGMDNTYQTTIAGTNYNFGDVFEYNFTITDNAGNIYQPEKTSVTIGDSKSPNLNILGSDIMDKVMIAAYTKHEVKIDAFDDSNFQSECAGVELVFINYTVDRGNTWNQINLVYDGVQDKYVGDIPGQTAGRQLAFMIGIVDRAGNVAYFDSTGYKTEDISNIVWANLWKIDITINWIVTISIVAAIAGVSILIYYFYARKGDYWDKMRRQAGSTAKFVSIQEKFTNMYYGIMGRLTNWGEKLQKAFTPLPGEPSPFADGLIFGLIGMISLIITGIADIFVFNNINNMVIGSGFPSIQLLKVNPVLVYVEIITTLIFGLLGLIAILLAKKEKDSGRVLLFALGIIGLICAFIPIQNTTFNLLGESYKIKNTLLGTYYYLDILLILVGGYLAVTSEEIDIVDKDKLKKVIKLPFKFAILAIISPFLLIGWVVKKTGGWQAFYSSLIALLMIIFSVIRFIGDGAYPLRAIFFINFGFILFIASFVTLIFHLIYRISYK